MTLRRKLFRPWDLHLKSNNNNNDESQESIVDDQKNNCPIVTPGHNVTSVSPVCEKSYNCDNHFVVSSSSSDVDSPNNIVMATSTSPNFLWPSNTHRGEMLDPFFTNSRALSELATLSRGELTAMGLLAPEPPNAMKVKRQRPKRFHCPHCQVAFSNNGQLRGHIRIHTGERPFTCEHEGCGKSFTRNEELTRHRRIHSGVRPFPCNYCGKKFGRKDHLKKHTRTHERGSVFPSSATYLSAPPPGLYAHPLSPSFLFPPPPSHFTFL